MAAVNRLLRKTLLYCQAEREDKMKPPKDCRKPDYHAMHLCILQHLDQDEAARQSDSPGYRCLRCNLHANRAANLCQPKKL